MRSVHLFCIAMLAGSVSGCGAALQHWENQNNFMVAADDIDPTLQSDEQYADFVKQLGPVTQLTGAQKKEYLGLLIGDSEFKCGKFLNGLALAENTSNTGLDIMTTIFSALGTAFTPLATVHAMTAGATITSGTKTAIDSDIYARATIGNYAQAIQASYYSKMNDYMNALTDTNADDLVVTVEIAKLRSIHKDCSLASAQSTIAATLTPPQPQAPAATTTDVWVARTVAAGHQFHLIALPGGGTVDLPITAPSAKPAELVGTIVKAVNGNADLQKAGVSAAAESDPTVLDLRSPAGAAVSWKTNPANEPSLQHRGQSTSAAAAAPAATAAPPPAKPSGVLTRGAIPGAALK